MDYIYCSLHADRAIKEFTSRDFLYRKRNCRFFQPPHSAYLFHNTQIYLMDIVCVVLDFFSVAFLPAFHVFTLWDELLKWITQEKYILHLILHISSLIRMIFLSPSFCTNHQIYRFLLSLHLSFFSFFFVFCRLCQKLEEKYSISQKRKHLKLEFHILGRKKILTQNTIIRILPKMKFNSIVIRNNW